MKYLFLMISLLILVMATMPAWAERRNWQERQIRNAADAVVSEVQAYQNECKKYADIQNVPGFQQFLFDLQNFSSEVQNFANGLGNGYDNCTPGFRRLRQTMRNLESRFSTNFESQPNPRARLGFYEVQLDFYKLEWEFTQDELNDGN